MATSTRHAGGDQAIDDAGGAVGLRGQRAFGPDQAVGRDLNARLRAGVMRGGCVAPWHEAHAEARLRRLEGQLALIIMRATMPSGASV